jgi:FkbM family methyltransferase
LSYVKDFIVANFGRYKPKGKLEELLISLYSRFWNPLYDLVRIIDKVELKDSMLFVKLKNGLEFYFPQDKDVGEFRNYLKYGNSLKLGIVKDLQSKNFNTFFDVIYGQFVKDEYECKELRRNDVIVDLGANIGGFSVKAAKAIGDEGKIIAIEPEPGNLSFLRRNIELNKLHNVTIVPKGVWSRKSRLRFYLYKTSAGHSVYPPNSYEWAMNNFIEIEVDTLDHILMELGVKNVDFIKMDIEGSEIEALKGMEETLGSGAKMAVAAYHFVNGKRTYGTLIPWFTQRKFNIRTSIDRSIIFCQKKS